MKQYKNNRPTLVRFDADTHSFLLRLTKAIESTHGVYIGRSTIVRAIITGVAKAKVDLIQANEHDMARLVMDTLFNNLERRTLDDPNCPSTSPIRIYSA